MNPRICNIFVVNISTTINLYNFTLRQRQLLCSGQCFFYEKIKLAKSEQESEQERALRRETADAEGKKEEGEEEEGEAVILVDRKEGRDMDNDFSKEKEKDT